MSSALCDHGIRRIKPFEVSGYFWHLKGFYSYLKQTFNRTNSVLLQWKYISVDFISFTPLFTFSGTDFMARLQEQLKYFVHNKLSTDKLWQNVKVYLSGHEVSCFTFFPNLLSNSSERCLFWLFFSKTPGEGEHKIMEFIRSENTKPGHDPNTRHCLYGLDADLVRFRNLQRWGNKVLFKI